MKIYKLFEDDSPRLFEPKISYKTTDNLSTDRYDKIKRKYYSDKFNHNTRSREPALTNKKGETVLGVGAGGYATQKADEHEVTKHGKIISQSLDNDAYFTYINTIVNDKTMQDNPYFPKVYNIKVYNQNNKNSYKIKMEKLININKLSNEEIKAISEKIMPDNWIAMGIGDTVNDLLRYIREFLRKKVSTKDKEFFDAINSISKIRNDNHDFRYDFHDENIAIRRTSVGPQLVILDPLHNDLI